MRRIVDSTSTKGEWSVGDNMLGYRICTYNDAYKGAKVHVHDRFNEVVGALPSMSKHAATRLVLAYMDWYDWFDIATLQELHENSR